jgi:hypothetical protein
VSTVSRRGYSETLKIPISERNPCFRHAMAPGARCTDLMDVPMVETIDGTATFVRNA